MIHDDSKKIDFFHGIFWRFRKRPYLCTVFKRERQQNQIKKGRLAQLVQSVCLTSRGSGVRIPQRPPIKNRRKQNRFLLFLFICQATKPLLNLIPKLFLLLLKRKKDQLSVKGRQRSAIYNIPYLMQLLDF